MSESDNSTAHFLISEKLDFFFLGAISLVTFLALTLLSVSVGPFTFSSQHFLILNVLVSYPHIVSSFYLFYGKDGNWRSSPIIAWVLPLLLILLLYFAVYNSLNLLHLLGQITLAYFFYHFLMQAMGCSLWLTGNARFNRLQFKRVLTTSALGIGILGWASVHMYGATGDVFDIPLPSLPVPLWLEQPITWASPFFLVGALFYIIRVAPTSQRLRFILNSFLPLLALYLWFSPSLIHSPYRLLVTTLHALQYSLFFFRTQTTKQRHPVLIAIIWGVCGVLGMLCFIWVPGSIEKHVYEIPEGTTGRLVSSVAIFLNLHHYLVDGTLWSLKRESNRKRLGLS